MAVRITKKLIESARQRLHSGAPACDPDLSREDCNRIERVMYMRFLVERNPSIDVFGKFKRIAAGRYATALDEWIAARKDKLLYDTLSRNSPETGTDETCKPYEQKET